MTNTSKGQSKTPRTTVMMIAAALLLIAVVVVVIIVLSSGNNTAVSDNTTVTTEEFDPMKNYVATIVTDKGDITIELRSDVAPKTVENFVKLATDGFYDGLTFHRVIAGFVAQGGDPAGDGSGGPGYTIEAEISELKHLEGTVATARQGDQVNPQRRSSGSQFYICLAPQPHLDNQYTIFGQVTAGMDTVLRIVQGDVMRKVTVAEKK
jgi:peptidyl-prolyl cis-trans isomerase B (cyclophilin B)